MGLNGFDATVREISRAVARLAHHGLHQFVITSDHGFLALTRDIGDHMIIPKPRGRGAVHRRVFIGRGGATDDALLRLSLDRVGLPGDLDVMVPRGLALIAAGGARGFFHGRTVAAGARRSDRDARSRSGRRQQCPGGGHRARAEDHQPYLHRKNRLAREPAKRAATSEAGGDASSRRCRRRPPATAGGAGLVRLHPGEEVTLGFRITKRLLKGQKIELQVLDARTDRRLGASRKPAAVARTLEVDDGLP